MPTTRPLVPRAMGVPETVIAGAFELKIVPAMATPLGTTVAGWPAAVMTGAGFGSTSVGVGMGRTFWTVEEPSMRSPFVCRAIGVPVRDIESPPRAIDWPSTTTTSGEDAAWITCPWIVVENAAAAGLLLARGANGELRGDRVCACPSIIILEAAGSTDTGWPWTCTADVPPLIVDPTRRFEFGLIT